MALNFPNTGLYPGLQYTGDNGVVYIYDGVKWVGHAPTLAPGTSSLVNGSNVVQVDGAGNLVIPDGATIIYQSGAPVSVANTGTIWTNNANGCLRAELSSTGFQAFTDASHLDLRDNGEWNIGSYQNSTFIGNDAFSNTNILSLKSGDETYITTNLRENGNHQWKFGVDGNLLLPTAPGGNSYTENKINAGGISIPNSVQLRTLVVGTDGVGITNSEIALEAGNGGFSSQVFGPFTGGADGSGGPTLVYAGVENVSGANGPGFAGFVAIDPNVTSQYVVQGNGLGGILGGGYGATTTKYVASLGTLAGADMGGNLFFNGVSADTTQTTVAGDTGVLIGTNTTQGQQYLWKFDNTGNLSAPGNIFVSNNQYYGFSTLADTGMYTDGTYLKFNKEGVLNFLINNVGPYSVFPHQFADGRADNPSLVCGSRAGAPGAPGIYFPHANSVGVVTGNSIWTFGQDSTLTLPQGGIIKNQVLVNVVLQPYTQYPQDGVYYTDIGLPYLSNLWSPGLPVVLNMVNPSGDWIALNGGTFYISHVGGELVSLCTDAGLTTPINVTAGTYDSGTLISLASDSRPYVSIQSSGSTLWTFGDDGELTLPNGGHLGPVGKGWTGLDGGNGQPVSLLSYYSTGTYAGCVSIYPGNGVQISTYGDGTGQLGAWTFGNDGALSVNSVATIATTPSVSCTATMDTIIYTSISNATTFKLLIKAEGYEGTPTAWDTQSSEMIIAHGFRNNTVVASVYGIIHTSTLPLAIFTAQWNAVTGRVEVLCRPTSLTSPVVVRTFATEIITSD